MLRRTFLLFKSLDESRVMKRSIIPTYQQSYQHTSSHTNSLFKRHSSMFAKRYGACACVSALGAVGACVLLFAWASRYRQESSVDRKVVCARGIQAESYQHTSNTTSSLFKHHVSAECRNIHFSSLYNRGSICIWRT